MSRTYNIKKPVNYVARPVSRNYIAPARPLNHNEKVLNALDELLLTVKRMEVEINSLKGENATLSSQIYDLTLQNDDFKNELSEMRDENSFNLNELLEDIKYELYKAEEPIVEEPQARSPAKALDIQKIDDKLVVTDPNTQIIVSTNNKGIKTTTRGNSTQIAWGDYYSIVNNNDIIEKIGEDRELMRKYSRAIASRVADLQKGKPLKKGTPESLNSNDVLITQWYKDRKLVRPK